jgi:hypothetical protein
MNLCLGKASCKGKEKKANWLYLLTRSLKLQKHFEPRLCHTSNINTFQYQYFLCWWTLKQDLSTNQKDCEIWKYIEIMWQKTLISRQKEEGSLLWNSKIITQIIILTELNKKTTAVVFFFNHKKSKLSQFLFWLLLCWKF